MLLNMNAVKYINNTVFCRLAPSPISGVGVFAIRDIPNGHQLTDFDGRNFFNFNLTELEFDRLNPEVRELILERTFFDKNKPIMFMSPNCNQVLGAFINHSKESNTDGVITLRTIKKGEELLKDYNLMTNSPHQLTLNKMKDIL